MSITGVSGVSPAAYLQQLQNAAQSEASTLAAPTVQAGSIQQPNQIHHHHGGGGTEPPSGPTQSGTTAAGGTGLLNIAV
jgi:hypothetical protein